MSPASLPLTIRTMQSNATQEVKVLEHFRKYQAATNRDLAQICKRYDTPIRRLRKKGVDITNARLSNVIGNKEGSLYVLAKDNPQVQPFYKSGFFSLDRKPIMVTEVSKGIVEEYPIDETSWMYQEGRKNRGIWQKIKEFFFNY